MNTFNLSLFALIIAENLGVHGLDETCTNNSDCENNARCLDGLCSCDSLSYFNDTLCLSYATEYGAICYEDAQCEWLGSNAECRNNRCLCETNYRWRRGECRLSADKGETCSTLSEDECNNGYDMLSLTCSSGECTCGSGYYDRDQDCRFSSGLSEGCAIHSDCTDSTETLTCPLAKCVANTSSLFGFVNVTVKTDSLNTNSFKKYTSLIINGNARAGEISCEKDDDCVDIGNSICNSTTYVCECNSETHYLQNGNCLLGFEECSTDADCSGNNTMCFKNATCICSQGFFRKDGGCIAEVGMPDPTNVYTSADDCPLKPAKIVDSVCYCKNHWFNDEFNRRCIKSSLQSLGTCLEDDWCKVMGPHSYCNSETESCQCRSYATLNETTYYCDKVAEPSNDACFKDTDCALNEKCLNEKCQCADNFINGTDNVCVSVIGGSCLVESCSHLSNSICLSGTCQCIDSYIDKQTRCLKVAENLFDSCEEDEQCQNLSNTVCAVSENEGNTDLQCICDTGYLAVNSTCTQTKKYGDPCMTESDCTLILNESYQCRNSACQCPIGSSLQNDYCITSAATKYLPLGIYTVLLAFVHKVVIV